MALDTRPITDELRAGDGGRPGPDLLVLATCSAAAALALLTGREGGTSWQIARVAAVAVLAVGAVVVQTRLESGWRGGAAMIAGVVSVAVGAGFVPFVIAEPRSVVALAAVVALLAGFVLVVLGVVTATAGHTKAGRVATGVVVLATLAVTTIVVGPAVMATNVPRPQLGATPATRGLAAETVALTTSDGVRLAGWYVPSRNGAAVALLHGAGSTRSDVLDAAAVLAEHGFGVLMVDARGHGESEGRAMDFGWDGDLDVAAATAFLARRTDVDRDRIGVVGMSMGGEEAIGASGRNALIRAVVAEGATARTAADEDWLSDEYGVRGLVQEQFERLQDAVTDALTEASVPTSLRGAVESSDGTAYLLIAAGGVPDEAHAAAFIAGGAPDRVDVWVVPGSGHTGGLESAPQAWTRHVIGFLTAALQARS